MMTLLDREEAWAELNRRFYMKRLSQGVQDEMVRLLLAERHGERCRIRVKRFSSQSDLKCTCGRGGQA